MKTLYSMMMLGLIGCSAAISQSTTTWERHNNSMGICDENGQHCDPTKTKVQLVEYLTDQRGTRPIAVIALSCPNIRECFEELDRGCERKGFVLINEWTLVSGDYNVMAACH